MFYMIERLKDSMKIYIEVTDENVFCRCPICGLEVAVDIAEILRNFESDLIASAVFCDECDKQIRARGGRCGNK